MAYDQHHLASKDLKVRCAVITLSDTRTPETDKSGQLIQRLITEKGHIVARYDLIKDEPTVLKMLVETYLARSDIDAILTNGGTGISPRDQTIDLLAQMIEKPIPGFGELFRMLSWEQIQSGAMLSRAIGGVANINSGGNLGKLIFAMPGSSGACELAMTKLILPELGHLVSELRK